MAFGLADSFNEPKTNDPTSAPSENVPSTVSQVLGQQRKKKKGFGVKATGPLASAISQSKRARQSSHKYGS